MSRTTSMTNPPHTLPGLARSEAELRRAVTSHLEHLTTAFIDILDLAERDESVEIDGLEVLVLVEGVEQMKQFVENWEVAA